MEQDPHDYGHADGELPSYNELAAQSSPNSRFGRWKGWVEKRAAERYAEESPETRRARRERGWGPHVDTQEPETPRPPSPEFQLSPPPGLNRTQTVLSSSHRPDDVDLKLPSTPRITVGQALPPSHLNLHTFGSRFLPHSELPILSCLPLFDHQKLLLGHTDGLTLLDMAPEEKSPELDACEPRRRDIWTGEGVYQMEILEHEHSPSWQTPVGVVLALVSVEPPDSAEKESKEPYKIIRMYNLASLADLVRWAASRKENKPLDLSRPSGSQTQQKKHKVHLGVSRGFMARGPSPVNTQAPPPPPPPKDWPRSSPHASPSKPTHGSMGSTDSWDIIDDDDDVPLRWATDFVPLASPSSRLANQSVISFELHRSTDGGRVTARLAVVTKQSILLYETVRGERAFRFVKEFYTPIPARSVTFVTQNPHEQTKTLSPGSTRSMSLRHNTPDFSSRRISSPVPLRVSLAPSLTGQLSLFVIFEKKAGLIKVADSSVGELELWEDATARHARRASGSFRRSMHVPDAAAASTGKGAWAPPAAAELPRPGGGTTPVYLLTRGPTTHIVPAPLPTPLAAHAPLATLRWAMRPARVVPRVCGALLQLTALGADGVEVQELDGAALGGKGKGRARAPVAVQAEVGPGGAGFLCAGGHWAEDGRALRRQDTASTVDTLDEAARRARAAGFYAWTQYARGDWRVFWLGGGAEDEP